MSESKILRTEIILKSPERDYVLQCLIDETWFINIAPLFCEVHNEQAAANAKITQADGSLESKLDVCCIEFAERIVSDCEFIQKSKAATIAKSQQKLK